MNELESRISGLEDVVGVEKTITGELIYPFPDVNERLENIEDTLDIKPRSKYGVYPLSEYR